MEEGQQLACPVCVRDGQESAMAWLPGRIRCPSCRTEFRHNASDPVDAALFEAGEEMRNRAPGLPRGMADLHGELADELQSVWWNVVTGRSTAAIVLMSSLVELVLAEVLYVHRYQHFKGSLGPLTAYLRREKLVNSDLLDWADRFRRQVRSPWIHHKTHEIVAGATVPVAKITFSKREDIVDQLEKVTSGEIPMVTKTVQQEPALRWPMKKAAADHLAPRLYKELWDWVNAVTSLYLLPRHYAGLHKNYEGPAPTVVDYKPQGDKVTVSSEAES